MSRNEAARSRRRERLREQMSLRSLPLTEVPAQRYTLDNHFGWKVLQKCRIGDGAFPPYLLHCVYCDKPEVPGVEGEDKVMYVLYIRGQDGDVKEVAAKDAKETQTATPAIQKSVTVVPKKEVVEEVKSKEKTPKVRKKSDDRKRVISDFYYIPVKDRTIARYDIRPAEGGDGSERTLTRHADPRKPKKGSSRTKPKSWQLRAGAEHPEDSTYTDEDEAEVTEDEEDETKSTHTSRKWHDDQEEVAKTSANPRKCEACIGCFSVCSHVELMRTPQEDQNRYLYLPKERYDKRPLRHRNLGSYQ